MIVGAPLRLAWHNLRETVPAATLSQEGCCQFSPLRRTIDGELARKQTGQLGGNLGLCCCCCQTVANEVITVWGRKGRLLARLKFNRPAGGRPVGRPRERVF